MFSGKVWKMEEYCMYFPFFKPQTGGKKSATQPQTIYSELPQYFRSSSRHRKLTHLTQTPPHGFWPWGGVFFPFGAYTRFQIDPKKSYYSARYSEKPAVSLRFPWVSSHMASAPAFAARALPSSRGSTNKAVDRASARPESAQTTVTLRN